jgi:hypothetical protein
VIYMRLPNKLPENSEISGTQLKRSFNQLVDAVRSNQINTSSKMLATRTVSGTTLSPVQRPVTKGGGGGGGGASYSGYFKLGINGATVEVWDNFTDSAYADATNAGLAQINNELFTIVKDAVTCTDDGFIYLQSTIDEDSVLETPTLEFHTSFIYAEDVGKVLLGRVTFSGGAVTSVTQEHIGEVHGQIFTENIILVS